MQSKPSELAPAPTEIELKSALQELVVQWSDDHHSSYSLRYLRGFCPCAECQGHALGDWTFIQSPDDIAVQTIEPVGNYAVSIHFSDKHTTGIYSWEVLRELCPCEACQSLHGDDHAMKQYPTH